MKKTMYLAGAVLAMGAVITPGIVSTHPVQAAEQNVTIPAEEVTGTQDYSTLNIITLIHDQVNQYRVENGLEPLKYSYNNAEVAAPYAQRLANSGNLVHESNWWTKASANVGNPYAIGENLAMRGSARNDRVDAASIVSQWKNSTTHNENLLRPQYDSVGYGVVSQGSQIFVVQRFTGYDNNENRHPADFYLYDSPAELPAFGQKKDINFMGDTRRGQTLTLENFDRGALTHPARVDTTEVRWYIDGAGTDYNQFIWESLLSNEPEALQDLVGLGSTNFTVPDDERFVGKDLTLEISQKSAWSDETFSHTFGPFTVQDVLLSNTELPTISGNGIVGETLTVNDGKWNRTPETVKYQWMRDGQEIPGATSKTYNLTEQEAGQRITARVSAAYQGDTPVSVTTAEVNVNTVNGPEINGTPTITASSNVPGGRLTANIAWEKQDVTTTYQWMRDGQNISGATSKTYTLTETDINKKISVSVKGTLNGATTTHVMNRPGNVDAPPITVTQAPKITGTPTPGIH